MEDNNLSFTEKCRLRDELYVLENALNISKDEHAEIFGYFRISYTKKDKTKECNPKKFIPVIDTKVLNDQKFRVTEEFAEKIREYIENRISEIKKKLAE